MSAVTGAGLGAFAGSQVVYAQINEAPSNGQSLTVGYGATDQGDTHLSLYDSTGNYNTSSPFAGTLSLVTGTGPIRPESPIEEYPLNIFGELNAYRMNNQLTQDVGFSWESESIGQSGEPYSYVGAGTCTGCQPCTSSCSCSGGTPNPGAPYALPWQALLYSIAASQHLAQAAGKSFTVPFTLITHGEADNQAYTAQSEAATYQAYMTQYQAVTQCAVNQILGKPLSSPIPLMLTQQHSFPPAGEGATWTAVGQHAAALASTAAYPIIDAGPKYQLTYNADFVHPVGTAQQLLGEQYAHAWERYAAQGLAAAQGFYPIAGAVSRSGSTVTIPCHVPVPPIVVDSTHFATAPHQSGLFSPWAAGGGIGLWDTFIPGGVTAIANDGGLIEVTWNQAESLTTGQVITLWDAGLSLTIGSGPAYSACQYFNKTWTVTAIDSTHFTLQGSAYSNVSATVYIAYPGFAASIVPISSVSVSGNSIIVHAGRTVGSDAVLDIAVDAVDLTNNGQYRAGYAGGLGTYTMFHDSDPWVGISGVVQYNWLSTQWIPTL